MHDIVVRKIRYLISIFMACKPLNISLMNKFILVQSIMINCGVDSIQGNYLN